MAPVIRVAMKAGLTAFTRISTYLSRSSAASRSRPTEAFCVMSDATAYTSPLAASPCPAVAMLPSALSLMSTRAPSFSNMRATASPMPESAPVTTAVRPFNP